MMTMDCTAPAIIAAFDGDSARCQLVTACQSRLTKTGVPVPQDIKSACEKVLADWTDSQKAHAAATVKPEDDKIRSLLKK